MTEQGRQGKDRHPAPPERNAQQREVISSRGQNLLVSAAAGAGKTTVLVERVVDLLRDERCPVDIDRLLVVTFTNAAAEEMRVRIRRELLALATAHPGDRHLQRQLVLVQRAPITTLHSFCLDVVRRNFFRLDLDPSFRVADDAESDLLRREVLETVLESRYDEHPGGDLAENGEDASFSRFARLVDCYGGERGDEGLAEMVLELHRFSQSHPHPDAWLRRAAQAFAGSGQEGLDGDAWERELRAEVLMYLRTAWHELERAHRLCLQPGGPAQYAPRIAAERDALARILTSPPRAWRDLADAVQSLEFGRLPSARKREAEVPELRTAARRLRENARERVRSLRATCFARPMENEWEDLRVVAPLVQELVTLVGQFEHALQRAKRQRGVVDFSDLEHYCLRLLRPEPSSGEASPVAEELGERFVEVLVDEYQDINPLQDAIIRAISDANPSCRVTMVGDVKQSIYRFRLADPGLFAAKMEDFQASADAPRRLVLLRENYRSRLQVVEAVNAVFERIMSRAVGEIDYDQRHLLGPGSRYPELPTGGEGVAGPVQVHLLPSGGQGAAPEQAAGEQAEGAAGPKGAEGQNEEDVAADDAQREAALVAADIARLVAAGSLVYDPASASYRPVGFGDVAVLMRSSRHLATLFVDEMRRRGVPATADPGTRYFAAPEVEVMLALLKVIDNPQQDIPLLAVLHSPVVGLSADDLAWVRAQVPAGSFFAAAAAIAGNQGLSGAGAAEPGPRVHRVLKEFWQRLEGWRTLARRVPVSRLVWMLLQDTGYLDYVGGMPEGQARQSNLRQLQEWAERYERTSFKGLFHFLRFIDRLREQGADVGAARLAGGEAAVRVLSIHKSKGLEFPVVYLVGTGRRFNLRSLDAPLLAHRELGVGPMRVDVQRSVQYPTLAYRAIRHRLLMETLAEEMRLLYVAVTRARERLVLVGTVRDPENSLRGWREVVAVDGADGPSPAAPGAPLPAGLRAQARSFLEWLGPALAALDAERPGSVQWPQVGPAPGERALFEVRCAVVPAMERSEQEGSARQEPVMPVAGDPERVAFRLGWRYPWAVLARRPAKVSVTEVKRAAEPGDRPQEAWRPAGECLPHLGGRPRFLQEEAGLSAVEVGIAMHTVMQHLELGGRLDADGIAGQVARMVAREILTPHQAQAVDREAIARFFAGELGQRLRRAGKVWRELPFTLRLPARELYPEPEAEGEHVVLQGVIDCLLEDEEGLVLIDFKSDRLTGGMEALAGRYRTQIGLYARAVTAITGRPLQAAYLYSFAGGASWRVQPGSEVAGGRGEGIE